MSESGATPRAGQVKRIAVIEGNEQHLKQALAALESCYIVLPYQNTARAIFELPNVLPDLVVVDEAAQPHGGKEVIALIRSNPLFAAVPIMIMLNTWHAHGSKDIEQFGADSSIVKPYRRSDLLAAVSSLINASIEREWEQLPEFQRVALRRSLDVFSNIADALDSDQPIPYSVLHSACTPLIEAVKRNDFKGVLAGVRNHDNYTYAHCLRVAAYMTMVGHTIGLRDKDLHLVAGSGLMHDVGKQTVPQEILNKNGKLDPDEWEIMKGHAEASVRCLRRHDTIPKLIIDVAGQHHERMDGTGYPLGLSASDLHEVTRMATIVDVFSALTDRRSYKRSMEADAALDLMTSEMSGHFDRTMLKIFIGALVNTGNVSETAASRRALAAVTKSSRKTVTR